MMVCVGVVWCAGGVEGGVVWWCCGVCVMVL